MLYSQHGLYSASWLMRYSQHGLYSASWLMRYSQHGLFSASWLMRYSQHAGMTIFHHGIVIDDSTLTINITLVDSWPTGEVGSWVGCLGGFSTWRGGPVAHLSCWPVA